VALTYILSDTSSIPKYLSQDISPYPYSANRKMRGESHELALGLLNLGGVVRNFPVPTLFGAGADLSLSFSDFFCP
jgi:hypothetical protein